jgi:peptidoglycan hydrolase-like protein with peptidoglycan-binding domain
MKDPIVESLAAIRSLESKEVLNEAALAAPATAVAGKGIGRFIPGVGAALGAYDAYGRAKQGDWAGAGLSAAGGLASLIPGVGTAASIGIAGAQALRDKQRTGSYMPGEDEIAAGVAKDAAAQPTTTATAPAAAPTPPGADPKVLALQKQLIAKGAKITADGKMGPATQTAMKQFPGTAVAEQNKGNDMSESQRIAELRDRLAQIESTPQIADEGIADLAKGAWQGVKNVGSAFKAGVADPAGAKALAPAATKAGEKAALATGAAVARNPGKVAAGAAAAGAAGMAALGGAATKPTDPKKVTPPTKVTPPAPAADPAQTPNAGADPADVSALNAMAAELENSQDPADIELLRRYNGIINAINNRAPGDKRTQGEIAANADAGSEPEPTK